METRGRVARGLLVATAVFAGATEVSAMPTMVEVAPFVKPCPADEKRSFNCADGVLIGDIVKELSKALGVEPSSVQILKENERGAGVVMHNKEKPASNLKVKGVRTLQGVPATVQVSGPPKPPSTLTKSQALEIQADTMEHYQGDLMKFRLQAMQAEIMLKWRTLGKADNREYNAKLRELLQPIQATFFPKYGFEATQKGMALMQGIFNSAFGDDEEIQANVNIINNMIGTDLAWLPPEMQELLTQPAAAPAAVPTEIVQEVQE